MPSYAALWPVRAVTVLGAAVFTPQAAAAIGHMAAPQERGRAITFIFIGWSVASVVGLPMSVSMLECSDRTSSPACGTPTAGRTGQVPERARLRGGAH